MKSPCEKRKKKSQKPRWYRYGCSLQAPEINPAARWGLCLGNHCTEVESKCYLASLSRQGAWMLWQIAALALRPSETQSGGARLCATWELRSLRPAGLGGPAWPGTCAGNASRHWHGTRDTREPSSNSGTGEAARRASNANPRAVNLPGQDSRDCGVLCRNVTLHVCASVCVVCVCLCVFHFSMNKKQQQEGSL